MPNMNTHIMLGIVLNALNQETPCQRADESMLRQIS